MDFSGRRQRHHNTMTKPKIAYVGAHLESCLARESGVSANSLMGRCRHMLRHGWISLLRS